MSCRCSPDLRAFFAKTEHSHAKTVTGPLPSLGRLKRKCRASSGGVVVVVDVNPSPIVCLLVAFLSPYRQVKQGDQRHHATKEETKGLLRSTDIHSPIA